MGLRVERHDRAAVLVFDWPERRNAIGPEEALEITATLKDIVKDPAVCGVVITGEGAFCAGGNLKGAVFKQDTSTEERSAAVYGAVHGMMQAIVNVPLPTVAAIDGPAIALGVDMALACDSRFIGPKGWCLQGWGKLGFVPGAGGEMLLRFRSPGVLWRLLEEQPRINAELAEKLNLGESSGESTARERAIARVNALAPMSRETLEAYVDLNRADLRSKMEHGLAAAAAKQLALLTRPGLEDRVKAALNK
jgi:2-(1,2-epoxy-1,2-dihydrophenyl)acetyl-CoA isomerase